MTTTQAIAPTSAMHPAFCTRTLCEDTGGDIAHREPPEPFVTLDEPVSVALVQGDERGDTRQIVHPAEIELAVGPTSTYLNADQAEALGRRLVESAHRARSRAPRDVSAA